MKTNSSHNVMVQEMSGSLFLQKLVVSALIIALMLSALPARAAFAAEAGTTDYAQEWSDKLLKIRYYGMFYERVRVYPADFDDPDELVQAHNLLNNYGVALRAAQRIVVNHSGFNQKGKVVNENLADQSLKDLSENLRLMRVYKEKLAGLEGEYRLLPVSAITTTASQ
ncbi:MAG: hypothetical protein ACM3PS_04820 [Syntrophothermus sp.]